MRLSGAIFDLDGVVLDTEGMYTKIWGAVGRKYHPEIEGFADMIKGMTLRNIMDKWFPGEELQREVDETLRRYEAEEMEFRYLNGADEYIRGLRERGIKTALATSSKREKIESVKRQIADIESLFDVVVTAEDSDSDFEEAFVGGTLVKPGRGEFFGRTFDGVVHEGIIALKPFSGHLGPLKSKRGEDAGIVETGAAVVCVPARDVEGKTGIKCNYLIHTHVKVRKNLSDWNFLLILYHSAPQHLRGHKYEIIKQMV